jgi:hypothetical protein
VARKAGKVLILSPHVMTAALVGWYVELAKLEPAFAAPGEHPSDALIRVKPLLVVLIDAESHEAVSDLFAARAAKRDIGLAMFSGAADDDAAHDWARRHGLPFFKLPVDLEAFGRVLDFTARRGAVERRVANRRRTPAVDRAIDGTLRLTDEGGRAWYVYDRRAGDRRTENPYRAFVSDEGLELRAPLSDDEFSDCEAPALIEQLSRAQVAG